jgi:hypothetical protein
MIIVVVVVIRVKGIRGYWIVVLYWNGIFNKFESISARFLFLQLIGFCVGCEKSSNG